MMKKQTILVLVFLVFGFQSLISQTTNPMDSLIKLLQNAKQDSTKAKMYSQLTEVCEINEISKYANEVFKISKKYEKSTNEKERNLYLAYKASAINNMAFVYDAEGNVEECILKYKEALSIREQIKDTNAIGNTLFNLAILYKGTGKSDEALKLTQKALYFLQIKKNYIGVSKCLFSIGHIFLDHGKIKDAIIYLEKSLNISKINGDVVGQNEALTGLGFIYGELGDLNKENEYLAECLAIQQKTNDFHGLTYTYNNIGFIYNKKNDVANAKRCYENSLKYALKSNELEAVALAYHNLGNAFRVLNQTDSAIMYYQRSIDLRNKISDEAGKSLTLIELGSLNLKLKNKKVAKKYFEEAFHIGEKLNLYETIRKSSDVLSSLYFENNNLKDAYRMQIIFKQYSDSLYNQENKKAVYKQQIKIDYEKKEAEFKLISKLENEKIIAQANSDRKRQQLIIYFISFILLLVFLIALFIYKNFKQKQKANVVLEEKNSLIELQKKEVESQKTLIEEHQKETIDSINYARRIQYALLANSSLLKENLTEHFVLFKPKDIVSGDFYWATKFENKFYLAVCDSTGHGVPGAFMSLLNMGFLNEAIREKNISQPNEVLNYVRKRLIESIGNDGQQDGMDCILICIDGKVELKTITYAAANNAPILISTNNLMSELVELPKDKMPVGKGERMESFKLQSLSLQEGDILYLYTDGYADQFGGPKGKKFKYKKLNDLLLSISSSHLNVQSDILAKEFAEWKGDLEQVDDVCVVGIRI